MKITFFICCYVREGHYLFGSPKLLIALWLKMRDGAGSCCGTEPGNFADWELESELRVWCFCSGISSCNNA